MVLTGKDLIKLVRDAHAEDFVIYIAVQSDAPLGVDYLPLAFHNVRIEGNTIMIS